MTDSLAARLRRMLSNSTPGEWALYDSNSWRRIGLKAEYREILWPCRTNDGIADFSGLNREADLAILIAAKNDLPALLNRIEELEEANLAFNEQADNAEERCESEYAENAALRSQLERAASAQPVARLVVERRYLEWDCSARVDKEGYLLAQAFPNAAGKQLPIGEYQLYLASPPEEP